MVRSLASHWHLCLPGLAILFNLWVLRAEPITTSNFNDSSVHLAMLRWARYQIDQGRIPLDGWYPNLGMGLPQFTHYQSLPHLIAAYISLVLGTDTTYYWSLYLLLAIWPISVYVGSRLLGWGRWTAAAAALVAPLLVSASSYGYEHTSYMWWGLGMWTQLVGMWLLPLAWGLSWRAVSGRGSYALGALAVALTIACHFLTGYLALLMIVVWVFIKPSELFVRLLRGVVVGGGAALIASWVIVPLLSDSRWQLATQYQQGTFWDDSYGAPKVLGWLFTGQIYDHGRLPVVTVLVAVGVAVCAYRFRKDERARAVLGAWVLSLLLFFGRPTLGSALKVLPGSDDLLFHRFLNGVHMAGIILAGVGAAWLASLVIQEGRRRLPRVGVAVAGVGVAGIGLLALLPAWTQVGTYDMQNASQKLDQQLADATDGADLQVLIDEAKLLGGGRVYAGSPVNWGAQYDVGFVPVYNVLENQDIDAIGFNLRTSSLMADNEVLFDERNPAQYDLFNIKYLILPADRPPAVQAQFLARQGRHTLWQVATSGYLEVVDTVGPPIVANRRNVGSQTAAFMASSQLANHQYPTVAFAGDPAAQPSLTTAPVTPSEAGTVESQSSRPVDGSFRGVIDANRPAVVLLKASYDPGWTLTVDGVPVKTQMIAPALVGGLVSPGRHTILFQYARYPYYPELLALGLITVLGLALVPRFLRRRGIHLSIAPPVQLKIPPMPSLARVRRSLAPVRHSLAPLGQSLRSLVLRARASLQRAVVMAQVGRGLPPQQEIDGGTSHVTDGDAMGRPRRVRMIRGRSVSPSSVLTVACAAVATVVLVDLAVRSAVRLDLRWDTFLYHLPFAALRGGLSIPYDMSDTMRPLFQGFPPLPDLVQGLLWRLTGSVNATGVVNFIAFGVFLTYAHKVLRAPFWLVALISLTAPMVLIHTTVSYIDLFGNAFLAIGVSSCLYAYLFPERPSRAVFVGGLAALAAAAWSKYLLVPVVVVMFIFFAAIVLRSTAADRFRWRQAAAIILVFATLAATPYVKNLVAYGNPVWPIRVPIMSALFPYVQDYPLATGRPPPLKDAPQAEVFVRSLFEINVPTQYQNPPRPRWIIDQGNSWDGFWMGGFWGFGVIVYLLITFGMLIAYRRRAGIVASVAGICLLCFVAVLPQSNELRYYMFIPLTWAATIGMLYPKLRDRFPRVGLGLLVLVLALFGHMVSENWTYYQIEKIGYVDAAVAWGAANWWPQLQRGRTYCVVDMLPIGIMMTGPTMSEYSIVDRSTVSLCPAGTIVVTWAGIQGPYQPQSEAQAATLVTQGLQAQLPGDLATAENDYRQAVQLDQRNKFAHYYLGTIYDQQGNHAQAVQEYQTTLVIDPNFIAGLFNLAVDTASSDPPSAEQLYRRVVSLQPSWASAWLNLGFVLQSEGKGDEARVDWAKAVSLDPSLASRIATPVPSPTPSGARASPSP
jgi:hypothetical protein